MSAAVERALASGAVGDVFSAVIVDGLTRTQIVQYAGASGDYNPVHTDEVYATVVAGLPSIFAHGMLTMGACGSFVHGLVGHERLTSFGVRFVDKVWPGDTLTARATIARLQDLGDGVEVTLDLIVLDQDDRVVLRGDATAFDNRGADQHLGQPDA